MEAKRPTSGRTIVHKARAVPSTAESPRVERPLILGESHIQLRIRDLDRSVRFYTEVVGFRQHKRSERQAILTCGPWGIGLIAAVRRTSDDDHPPREAYQVDRAGLQHLAFALGNAAEVDAAAEWLDLQNVPHKPVSNGYTPGSRFVTFYDPDGIPLEFYYMDAAYADVYGIEAEIG